MTRITVAGEWNNVLHTCAGAGERAMPGADNERHILASHVTREDRRVAPTPIDKSLTSLFARSVFALLTRLELACAALRPFQHVLRRHAGPGTRSQSHHRTHDERNEKDDEHYDSNHGWSRSGFMTDPY